MTVWVPRGGTIALMASGRLMPLRFTLITWQDPAYRECSGGVDVGVVVVYLVVLLVADVLLAFIPASIARSKGRSGFAFYMFGLLFFVPATITAAVLKPDEAELRIKGRVVVRNICPHCRSDIPRSATVCPHCTRDIYTPKPMDVARSTIEADLRRVDELHESGVLTATEHQEARSKLIDRHVGG